MQRKSAGVSPHEKAKARADRLDRTFFMQKGGTRTHYVRRSLPFEFEGWGPQMHNRDRYVVVTWRGGPEGDWIRIPFSAKQDPDPDEITAIAVFDLAIKLAKQHEAGPRTILRPTPEQIRESEIVALSAFTKAKHPEDDMDILVQAAADLYDSRHPKKAEVSHVG